MKSFVHLFLFSFFVYAAFASIQLCDIDELDASQLLPTINDNVIDRIVNLLNDKNLEQLVFKETYHNTLFHLSFQVREFPMKPGNQTRSFAIREAIPTYKKIVENIRDKLQQVILILIYRLTLIAWQTLSDNLL